MTAATLVVPLRSSCVRCGTGAAANSRYCSECGTAFPASTAVPVDVATRRTVAYTVLTLVANIVVGAATFAVVYVVIDTPRLMTAALVLEGLQFVVVGALVALTLRWGARAVRLTRDGRTRMSPWAVLGIIVTCMVGLSLIGSVAAVGLMSLGAFS